MTHPLVVAITGASGAIFATRLLETLRGTDVAVELSISPPGVLVLKQELGLSIELDNFAWEQLFPPGTEAFDHCPATAAGSASDASRGARNTAATDTWKYHGHHDFMASIASGSHRTRGMIVCPCSGSTLSALVTGASQNLIHRTMEVHLKEKRPLVLVPRESPLSQVALDNLQRAGSLGATILPAMPGWYHGVRSARDLVDFMVARILDQFAIEHHLMRRWGGD